MNLDNTLSQRWLNEAMSALIKNFIYLLSEIQLLVFCKITGNPCKLYDYKSFEYFTYKIVCTIIYV